MPFSPYFIYILWSLAFVISVCKTPNSHVNALNCFYEIYNLQETSDQSEYQICQHIVVVKP